jgi:Rieske Fe-S protein
VSTNENLTRKTFLQISTQLLLWLAGALGLGGLVRYFSHEPESGPPTSFDLGPMIDFPPVKKTILQNIPAVIFQNDGEFLAYSLSCTHLGCTLEESDEGFSCPCHGSLFSSEGKVLEGPALENLPALRLEINQEGNLILYTKGAGQ